MANASQQASELISLSLSNTRNGRLVNRIPSTSVSAAALNFKITSPFDDDTDAFAGAISTLRQPTPYHRRRPAPPHHTTQAASSAAAYATGHILFLDVEVYERGGQLLEVGWVELDGPAQTLRARHYIVAEHAHLQNVFCASSPGAFAYGRSECLPQQQILDHFTCALARIADSPRGLLVGHSLESSDIPWLEAVGVSFPSACRVVDINKVEMAIRRTHESTSLRFQPLGQNTTRAMTQWLLRKSGGARFSCSRLRLQTGSTRPSTTSPPRLGTRRRSWVWDASPSAPETLFGRARTRCTLKSVDAIWSLSVHGSCVGVFSSCTLPKAHQMALRLA